MSTTALKVRCARRAFWTGVCLLLAMASGCIVPQPRGDGKLQYVVEPASKRGYWLYLPAQYIHASDAERAAARWPLVMTFHGMKPYDVAHSQALEWEREADRYGYIVVAPELTALVFVLGEFPITTINQEFRSDELASLAILDHVLATTHADPNNVLATSWSSGGYIGHYMLNRHPDKFTCLVARQSDFSAEVLDSKAAARALYHPVFIITSENDIPVCIQESREAIKWYENHGFRNLAWVHMKGLRHERTPDMAAYFFSLVCGAMPNQPPAVLLARQAVDGNATGLALLAGNLRRVHEPAAPEPIAHVAGAPPVRPPTRPRPMLLVPARPQSAGGATADATPEPPAGPVAAEGPPSDAEPPVAETAPPAPTPEPTPAPEPTPSSPLAIRVSSTVGFQPLLIAYSAECPSEWHRTALFHWTLNGQDIGDSINGQRTLTNPGDYTLELLVVTSDGQSFEAQRQIRVLPSVERTAHEGS